MVSRTNNARVPLLPLFRETSHMPNNKIVIPDKNVIIVQNFY